ncbi:hypothetical protein [Crateriforma spongiae]|uniref:hypothetical protein n=1 Tax=Crateriforma spongiae TaxID=2724528 RepID=UPI0039B0F736
MNADTFISRFESSDVGGKLSRLLPAKQMNDLRSEADYYGALWRIASLRQTSLAVDARVHKSEIGWQHGWVTAPVTDYRQVTGLSPAKPYYLVASTREQSILSSAGLVGIPVGLPFAYARVDPIHRVRGSVLVMPAHGTDHTLVQDATRDYLEFIRSLRDQFDHVVACISAPCLRRGVWQGHLQSIGVPWIEGADIRDGNALNRMKTLFSFFETMTSNAIGSHFAYAACSGCRVSLCGPMHGLTADSLRSEPYYQTNPDLVDIAVYRASEACTREHYPQLFCDPVLAPELRTWGREQIGWSHQRDANEMARLLQTGWLPRIRRKIKRSVTRRFSRAA